jgi:hypothetical protein
MRHRFALILAVLSVLILRTPQALAAGLPLIDSTTINYSTGTLIVTGQNFGSNPTVMLDKMSFPVLSSSGTRNGTLYTVFLATLNSDMIGELPDHTNSDPSTCFANHCDWRMPNLIEFKSIVELSAPGCGAGSPCIDPAFGPAQASTASFYYSSSELAGSPGYAWAAFFFNGHVTTMGNVPSLRVQFVPVDEPFTAM